MANKFSGLGRGLGSLIPQKTMTPSAVAPTAVAVRPEAKDGGVMQVSVAEIAANPQQPRSAFRHHELEELTNSIKEHGILQPLLLTRRSSGGYELIAGERRLRAARLLGLKTVPAIVRAADTRDKLLLALIENIQREDLNPIEEARAYAKLAADFSLTQEAVAQKVGKGRSTVANSMRLLDLPEEIQEAISAGSISAGSARAILGLKDDASRLAYFRKLIGQGATTRQVEAQVRKASGRRRKDPAVAAAEEQIRNKLGTRVEIRKKGGKGSVIVSFFSEEEYQSLVKALSR